MKYIDSIRITNFLGKGNLIWKFKREVNILAGANGTGKSVVMEAIYNRLANLNGGYSFSNSTQGHSYVYAYFADDEHGTEFKAESVAYLDFSDPFLASKETKALGQVNSDLKSNKDVLLHKLAQRYSQYRLMLSTKVIKQQYADSDDFKEYFQSVHFRNELFENAINKIFKDSGKSLFPSSKYPIAFSNGSELSIFDLSGGEKNILIMLITALLFNDEDSVLLINKPETSLHISVQEILIDSLRMIAPNTQLIIVTHSPSIVQKKGTLVDNIVDLIYENE